MRRDAGGTAEGLAVEGLGVAFEGGRLQAVSDVSFHIKPGEALGLVGESGSGKSLTARAVLGLLPRGAAATGRIALDGRTLTDLSECAMRSVRGAGVGMIFQDPMSSLNPVLRVGDAVAQVVRAHRGVGWAEARRRAVALLRQTGIRDPDRRAGAYPHEFSGGMRQRVMIAMALAAGPRLLLADEPTTALDVMVQADILRLLDRLRREAGMGLLLVSHDLALVASVADRVAVMYAGQVVETGTTAEVLRAPLMPYTAGLLASSRRRRGQRRLTALEGLPPGLRERPSGCRFAPRCPLVVDACRAAPIPMTEAAPGRLARCLRSDLVPVLHAAGFNARRLSQGRRPAVHSDG